MAATEHRWARWLSPVLGRLSAWGGALAGLMPGLMASVLPGGARAVDLPADKAEAMYHLYDGGGVKAQGPALLVRKSLADKISFSATQYVDAVSNASIDVVTTASPYRERRTENGLGLTAVVRDTLMNLSLSRSEEPDYRSDTASLDITQEVFGGMTAVALGFGSGQDKVGKTGAVGFIDSARRWQWRLGATQVLSPRWLVSLNGEAISEDGFLGNQYRVARVFGAAVPERDPRTRTSRAVKFRVVGDLGDLDRRESASAADGSGDALPMRHAMRAEVRSFWDTWGVRATTLEAGYSRYFSGGWLADAYVRHNSQTRALFYSDNASSETTYVSRNRQLASFRSSSVGTRVSWTASNQPGHYQIRLNGSLEKVRFAYSDFTDVRTGQPYAFGGTILQLYLSATF